MPNSCKNGLGRKINRESELTEKEQLLEGLIDIEDETEQMGATEEEARKQKIEKENGQALEMRGRAMERLGQTKKKNMGS